MGWGSTCGGWEGVLWVWQRELPGGVGVAHAWRFASLGWGLPTWGLCLGGVGSCAIMEEVCVDSARAYAAVQN